MSPRKKPQKSHEQQTAENYFPVAKEDLKYAIEKSVKEQPEAETVEKIGKPKRKYIRKKRATTKNSTTKIRYKNNKKELKYEPPKISLKQNGYELIITEKPQAAAKIAAALSNGKDKKTSSGKGINYYE